MVDFRSQTSNVWFRVLDCSCGCGYSRLVMYVFKDVHDRDFVSSFVGDSFPADSLYPVYVDWLGFFATVRRLHDDCDFYFEYESLSNRLEEYLRDDS